MYQNNLLAKLGANRELFGRMFPYIPQPQEPAPIQPQQPVQQDPMHGNAGAMEKYGQESPQIMDRLERTPQPQLMDTLERTRQPQPTVYEGNTPNPPVSAGINSPHAYDTRTIAAPEMSQDGYNGRKTAVPDVTGISNPYERQLILAQDEFDNPVNKDKGWKGWLKEFAQNFAAGINNTNPNANLFEKLGAGLGGGGVGAADRTQNERRQAGMQIPIIRDRIANQQQMEYRKAQTANIYKDNETQQLELERKREKDANTNAYYMGLLEDKKRGRELQTWQIDDLKEYRKFLISNGTRGTDARIRQIDAKLEDADLDRKSRENIAANRITAQEKITGMNIGSRERIAGVKEGNSMTKAKINSADRARSALLAIEKNAPQGATPEQIEAKRQQFLNTLDPEIRKSLGF